MRILVCDDNKDFADTLAVALRHEGHDVRVSYEGIQCLAHASEFNPDVAFLDIGMPGLTGYEVARQLRSSLSPDLVVVAITGWGTRQDQVAAKAAGFDLLIQKPPELRDVLKIASNPVSARSRTS